MCRKFPWNTLLLASGVLMVIPNASYGSGNTHSEKYALSTDVVEVDKSIDGNGHGKRGELVWERLFFTHGGFIPPIPPSEQRTITRIKITLFGEDVSIPRVGLVGKKPVVYETADPAVLEAMTRFLSLPYRCAIPEYLQVVTGASILGTIDISTTKDDFTIFIDEVAFLLTTVWELDKAFFSWGLAHFLDDLCFRETGRHLPNDVLLKLTGESRISSERAILQELQGEDKETGAYIGDRGRSGQ